MVPSAGGRSGFQRHTGHWAWPQQKGHCEGSIPPLPGQLPSQRPVSAPAAWGWAQEWGSCEKAGLPNSATNSMGPASGGWRVPNKKHPSPISPPDSKFPDTLTGWRNPSAAHVSKFPQILFVHTNSCTHLSKSLSYQCLHSSYFLLKIFF